YGVCLAEIRTNPVCGQRTRYRSRGNPLSTVSARSHLHRVGVVRIASHRADVRRRTPSHATAWRMLLHHRAAGVCRSAEQWNRASGIGVLSPAGFFFQFLPITLDRDANQSRARAHAGLREQLLDYALDQRFGHAELIRDFLVGLAAEDS